MQASKSITKTYASSICESNNPVFITTFLKGAIPSSIIRDIKKDHKRAWSWAEKIEDSKKSEARKYYLRKLFIKQVDELLDTRPVGPHFLRSKDISQIVLDSIMVTKTYAFKVLDFKILSNHVHLLVDGKQESMEQILQKIKNETAEIINPKLKRIGPVWEDENFYLEVNDQKMLDNIKTYIRLNTSEVPKATCIEEDHFFTSKSIKTMNKAVLIYSEFGPRIIH